MDVARGPHSVSYIVSLLLVSDPTNFVAVFSVILRGKRYEFSGHFRSKKFRCSFFGNFEGENDEFLGNLGGVAPIRKVCCKKAQHSFPKRGRGGGVRGRLEVFQKFFQNGK